MQARLTVITRKGQITIPVEFRRILGLKEGDRVAVVLEGDQVRLMRAGSVVGRTAGSLKSDQPSLTAEGLREVAEQAIAEDVVGRLEAES